MQMKFLISGTSPDIGAFKTGEIRDIPADIGEVFMLRKIAEKIKPKHVPEGLNRGEEQPAKSASAGLKQGAEKTEVKGDGR